MMKQQLLAGKALVLCLFLFTAAKAAPVPATLTGNWLATDGSNRFVIGIYAHSACYENETWQIRSAEEVQGRWRLQLQHGDKTASVVIQRKDSVTLLLGDAKQQALKNIRTFNYRYKPVQPAFPRQLFKEGSAIVKGVVQWNAKRRDKENYIQLSYNDIRTGRTEYFFADFDSADRFSLQVPLHMPLFCHLSIGTSEITSFLVQPGDTLLLALNMNVYINEGNPNYNELTQRLCFMGASAAFNNQYQHYRTYASRLDIKPEKIASASWRDVVTPEKRMQQFTQFLPSYDTVLRRIDVLYPAYAAEQRFIEYVKAETRYKCAQALLDDSKMDSQFVQKVYDQFLAKDTTTALVHESYATMAYYFSSRLADSHYGNSRRYSIPLDKMKTRIQNDYGPLLSNGFVDTYTAMQADWEANRRLSDSAIIQKYFKGSREEALAYRYVVNKITDEFRKETDDSTAYQLHAAVIPNTTLRFAVNLLQLKGRWRGEDDLPIPSLYRIAIFKQYNQLTGFPWEQVAAINSNKALTLGVASMGMKIDTTRLRQLDHEADWQKALAAYRGKTVVVWFFSHYFRKENAARNLYELKKAQERYKGQNVVFLKCIQQRDRSDKVSILLQYMDIFNEQGQLKDVFYVSRLLSPGAMLESESIDRVNAIYNTEGQPHHPAFYVRNREKRDYDAFTLAGELDSVLAGRGHYYDEAAGYFLKLSGKRNYGYDGDMLGDMGKTWTLYDSTGQYYFYVARTPAKPVYELNYDTVYHLLSFLKDSTCFESKLVFHKRPPVQTKERQFFSTPDYERDRMAFGARRRYIYTPKERTVRLYDDKMQLFRTYKLLFINEDCLVLQLVQ